jgi:hypothetical protein
LKTSTETTTAPGKLIRYCISFLLSSRLCALFFSFLKDVCSVLGSMHVMLKLRLHIFLVITRDPSRRFLWQALGWFISNCALHKKA